MGNASTLVRICRECGKEGSVPEDFEQPRKLCRTCRVAQQVVRHKARRQEDPSYVEACRSYMRTFNYKRLYGLTPAQRDVLFAGGCGICKTFDDLCIDHNHATGLVRGALCRTHNIGIGMFKEDPAAMLAAIAYLERN